MWFSSWPRARHTPSASSSFDQTLQAQLRSHHHRGVCISLRIPLHPPRISEPEHIFGELPQPGKLLCHTRLTLARTWTASTRSLWTAS